MKKINIASFILCLSSLVLNAQTKEYYICFKKGLIQFNSGESQKSVSALSDDLLAKELKLYGINKISMPNKRINELQPSIYKSRLQRTYIVKINENKTHAFINSPKLKLITDYIEKKPSEELLFNPNDYNLLWDQNISTDWSLDLIDAKNAWNITKGSPNIEVAIIDSHFDINHPDLVNQVVFHDGEECSNNIQNSLDCFYCSHGTRVAGVAGAETNNGIGKSSLGYKSKLRLYSNFSTNKILDAALDGADVINCSFGSTSFSQTNQNIVNAAINEGSIIVAAAGNGQSQNIYDYYYPASYENVISVTSVDKDKEYPNFNHNNAIDVSAPGISVPVTLPQNLIRNDGQDCYFDSYIHSSGTSFSAPIVSGLVALMLDVNPCLETNDIEYILKQTGESINNYGNNSYYINTYGTNAPLIDAYAAVLAAQNYPQIVINNASISGNSTICNSTQVTFNLNDVPENTGAFWSKSSNLSIVSGQGTSSITIQGASSGNGAGWIKANLSGNCGGININQKDVWVGKPPSLQGFLNGPDQPSIGNIVLYSFGETSYQNSYSILDWTLPYAFPPCSPSSGNCWEVIQGGDGYTIFKVKVGSSNGYIQVKRTNSCGSGGAKILYVTVQSTGGGCPACPLPIAAPNPSNIEARISFINAETGELYDQSLFDHSINYSLMEMSGFEVKKKSSRKMSEVIDLTGVKNGLYMLSIHHEGIGTQMIKLKVKK